jgi:hypothetical protein
MSTNTTEQRVGCFEGVVTWLVIGAADNPQRPVLWIRLPESQRSLALQHCFIENAHDSTSAASLRTDCSPLYRGT